MKRETTVKGRERGSEGGEKKMRKISSKTMEKRIGGNLRRNGVIA